jgi:hypothetical protein
MPAIENETAQSTCLSPSTATASQTVVAQQVKCLFGWSLNESTGSGAAKVRLRDGTSAAGKLLAVVNLASAASSTTWLAEQAVQVNTGAVYLEVVSGSVEGCLYWG